MARMTSRAQFNDTTFSFEGATAAAATSAVLGTAGGYRYGVNLFENTMVTTYNAGASRLYAYGDDIVRNGSNLVTAGTVDAFIKQNLSGTTWISSFILSDIGASATAYDAALRSASTTDDRTFLASVLAGDDLIALSKFDDVINSRAGDDTVRGGYGNDNVNGDAGADYLDGGSGLDTVNGGTENDTVLGGRGDDTIYGSDGNDLIRGGDGNDLLSGGSGQDVFYFRMGDDTDTISSFVQGWDMLQVSGMGSSTAWTKEQVGANTLIKVLGIEIIVANTLIADMTAADFIL
jgi:Ca2+-binding RTX toxin-like protein